MRKPLASLSLDLDNKWSYMKTHGDAGWESFPSYLDVVVPRVLDFLAARDLKITFFIVGQDAALERNREPLARLSAAGHEIGNHSFRHEPWLHLYSPTELDEELQRAEEHIERATGARPRGFRGPGFSLSHETLRALARRGYEYDASTFPTFLGPLARAYYFMTARLDDAEMEKRRELFGKFGEGFRPLKPYRWRVDGSTIVELPVTTMPLARVPIHVSYLLYLGQFAPRLALLYFRTALALARATGTQVSLLLHPLDFLGAEDVPELAFFPAMRRPAVEKLELVGRALRLLTDNFEVVPLREHARRAATSTQLPLVEAHTLDQRRSQQASSPIASRV
ncbi:MAG TPA: polysaccharide deacetylase family protein [Pyrinomonadaceae bacterium]